MILNTQYTMVQYTYNIRRNHVHFIPHDSLSKFCHGPESAWLSLAVRWVTIIHIGWGLQRCIWLCSRKYSYKLLIFCYYIKA